ncbi:MAG TPA: zinc/iron-chelating domain-containing protein [Chitinophagaceae bacterium]|nr:YkgJ family cysteine cluster protein [Chitinophagaceae bacterium]HAL95563.1 zinc/iron-chelating domain-containing protein [Chitinophagaceae bacterium]
MKNKKSFSLRSFISKRNKVRRRMRIFLTKLEKQKPSGIDKKIGKWEKEVWKEVDCLSCANCCKTMTPTYTVRDLKRISKHFGMTVTEFKKKWLHRERGGDRDWMNKSTPCQFLNKKDNKCSIYAIRPADCAGFPHLAKDFQDFVHIHHQNVDSCPATFALVEKMMADFQK